MEKLLQYLWQHRLRLPAAPVGADGEELEIVDQGIINNDAGPDFFNAKIKIDGRLWAGNVEIHVRASDWYRHGHDRDAAYDNVVLHVVEHSDMRVTTSEGRTVAQLEMPVPEEFRHKYEAMQRHPLDTLACAGRIGEIEPVHLHAWITALGYERLQAKAAHVNALANEFDGDWNQALYTVLARALGFGVNSEPFERLARHVPLKYLRKHADMPATVEGALFGEAGFLDTAPADDPYVERLRGEHSFMAAKYGLTPMRAPGWKMARMRPYNFPHRRIAALAAIVCNGFEAGYRVGSIETAADARELFDVTLKGYWEHRFTFGSASARSGRAFSEASLDLLAINVVAPAIYASSRYFGTGDGAERALRLLEQLPPERNSIVRLFTDAGVGCPDAFTSQALIQLRKQYCRQRKCLYCRIGYRLLAHVSGCKPST